MDIVDRLNGAVVNLMQDISETHDKKDREFWLNFSKFFGDASVEITSLRNQLAECQKDAERYRFIKSNLRSLDADDFEDDINNADEWQKVLDKAMSEKC